MADVCFQKQELVISSRGLRHLAEIWYAGRFRHSQISKVTKTETGSIIAMPWPPSWKWIWRHNYVADGPIWTNFGRPMQNGTTTMTTTQTWRPKPEVEFQHGRRLFLTTEVVISQPRIEISRRDWSAGRFRPFQISKATKTETGSRIAMPWIEYLRY